MENISTSRHRKELYERDPVIIGTQTNINLKLSVNAPLKARNNWVVAAHAFNPSTREAEAGGFLNSELAWST